MVLRLRGGGAGLEFVDVTKGAIKQLPWARNGPQWRSVGKGLVINGRCLNSECEAFNQVVYCTIGLKKFDLILEQDRCVCPQCYEKFVPNCPGFNNCYWKLKTVKAESKETFSSHWSKAGNFYTTYDEQASGRAKFSRIQFLIRRNHGDSEDMPQPKNCGICFKTVYANSKLLDFQHGFHEQCLKTREDPTECIFCS